MFKKHYSQRGFILITSIILLFVCSGIILAFYSNIDQEHKRVEIKILQSKAKYNAVSGLALKAYENMFYRDFITDTLENGLPATDTEYYDPGVIEQMGGFTDVSCSIEHNTTYGNLYRYGQSSGYSQYTTFWGNTITLTAKVDISTGQLPKLSTYMYLTGEEKAGGAPQTMNDGVRGDINFREQDQFSGGDKGEIQSNGSLVMAGTGNCPTFYSTVTLTENDDGTVNYPELNGCNENNVFRGEPPLDTAKAVCLPPPSFDQKKRFADYTFDATAMFPSDPLNEDYPGGFLRDTLIMTEIKFNITGGFHVRRYWYLMAPHLESGFLGIDPQGTNLDTEGCEGTTAWCNCDENDITECNAYEQFLNRYHARTVENGTERYIDEDIRLSHGTHHFDTHNFKYDSQWGTNPEFSPISQNSTMISNEFYAPSIPTAIHIKGGPVLVHGTYKGKYTIITDEYITYRRHAYPSNNAQDTPIDTLMCNIWLIGDLKNADANPAGSMASMQPTTDCRGGSDNIMGLVSGANVIIANTRDNGARSGNAGNLHINIHAHMIAFNESFTIQYWQNSTSYWNDWNVWDVTYGEPRTYKSDGNGLRYGTSTNADDDRGNIYLWGGFVQLYRGYMFRNTSGPYNITPGIGMDKNYFWDDNLRCTEPPLYPESLECDEEGNSSGQYNFPIESFRIF